MDSSKKAKCRRKVVLHHRKTSSSSNRSQSSFHHATPAGITKLKTSQRQISENLSHLENEDPLTPILDISLLSVIDTKETDSTKSKFPVGNSRENIPNAIVKSNPETENSEIAINQNLECVDKEFHNHSEGTEVLDKETYNLSKNIKNNLDVETELDKTNIYDLVASKCVLSNFLLESSESECESIPDISFNIEILPIKTTPIRRQISENKPKKTFVFDAHKEKSVKESYDTSEATTSADDCRSCRRKIINYRENRNYDVSNRQKILCKKT